MRVLCFVGVFVAGLVLGAASRGRSVAEHRPDPDPQSQPTSKVLMVMQPDPTQPDGRRYFVLDATDEFGAVTIDRLPADVWVIATGNATFHARAKESRAPIAQQPPLRSLPRPQ